MYTLSSRHKPTQRRRQWTLDKRWRRGTSIAPPPPPPSLLEERKTNDPLLFLEQTTWEGLNASATGRIGRSHLSYVDIVYYHVVSQNLSSGSSFFFFFHFLHLFPQLVTVKTLLNNVWGIPAESSTGENSHLSRCAYTLSLVALYSARINLSHHVNTISRLHRFTHRQTSE
jgi:hypothetical protein